MTCNTNQRRHSSNDGCVCTDVKLIDAWQQDVSESGVMPFCTGPTCCNTNCFNTIPFQLILPSGARFTVDLSPETNGEYTDILRVEEVYDNCCARVRGLVWCDSGSGNGNGSRQPNGTLLPTEICCTVDLNQCVGIQFLPCTYVPTCENITNGGYVPEHRSEENNQGKEE